MTKKEVRLTFSWEIFVGLTLAFVIAIVALRTMLTLSIVLLLRGIPSGDLAIYAGVTLLSASTLISDALVAVMMGLSVATSDWSFNVANWKRWKSGEAFNCVGVRFTMKGASFATSALLCFEALLAFQCVLVAEVAHYALIYFLLCALIGDILLSLFLALAVAVDHAKEQSSTTEKHSHDNFVGPKEKTTIGG